MDPKTIKITTMGSHFEIDDQVSQWRCNHGYYRTIIPKSLSVKYLALPDLAPSFPDICGEKLDFTTVPDGGWSIGYLIPQPGTNKYSLGSTERTVLAGISRAWHPIKVDWAALNEQDYDVGASDLQSTGQMYSRVYKNHFGHAKVVVSCEWMLGA
jgi:hypothetical protein